MKLTLRHEWRPRPFRSFLSVLDLKIGVQLALYFAILNKVAGVYGLIALFTGGSLAQLSLYIYSVCGLFAYMWGLRAVSSENPEKTTLTAHIFLLDHLIGTLWTAFFGVAWWIYTPHDGKRVVNSAAQIELATGGAAVGHHPTSITEAQRAASALQLWNQEKALAASVIVIGWLFKVYFCLLLYSYSFHLRNDSYRSLPLSKPNEAPVEYLNSPELPLGDQDLDDVDAYQIPISSAAASVPTSARPTSARHTPMLSGASFTEFVGAHTSRPSGWPEYHNDASETVGEEEAAAIATHARGSSTSKP